MKLINFQWMFFRHLISFFDVTESPVLWLVMNQWWMQFSKINTKFKQEIPTRRYDKIFFFIILNALD